MRFFNVLWKELREMFRNGNEPDHIRLIADLYWKALLVLALSVLVAVFVYSTWGAMRILGDLSNALDTAAPPPPALNRGELNAVIHVFETRKTEFDALKNNSTGGIKDPSL